MSLERRTPGATGGRRSLSGPALAVIKVILDGLGRRGAELERHAQDLKARGTLSNGLIARSRIQWLAGKS